jgi:serine protease Do
MAISSRIGRAALAVGLVFWLAGEVAWCQQPVRVVPRSSTQFLDAFKPVTANASLSTVRIRSAGRDVALGTVVGEDGWVLTKASALGDKPTVRLADGQDLQARVVGIHDAHDLALLKIEAEGLTAVEWLPGKNVAVGNWAITPGPAGRPVAVGVVSVGVRNVPSKSWPRQPHGGGFLGVSLDSDDKEVKISQVVPGGGAAKAGLKVNDTILAVAGKAIDDTEMLLQILGGLKPGDEIELRVRRGEQELTCKAKLGKRPMDRGDFQNSLGSLLSKRRTGFPTILQHDSVLLPSDCGGPLVDLSGRAIGINICRAGRTESYAVPAAVVSAVLPDLQAGRYAPKSRGSAPASGQAAP